jgi:hypothetical protein
MDKKMYLPAAVSNQSKGALIIAQRFGTDILQLTGANLKV